MEGGRGGDNEDYKDEAKQRDQEKTTSQQPCRCQVLNSNLGKLIIKCRFWKMIIYVFLMFIFLIYCDWGYRRKELTSVKSAVSMPLPVLLKRSFFLPHLGLGPFQ